ncbi:pyridoxamine 5'-phosphate oxidase family protein [Paenibacillus tarimensis]|uniref:pyridoxamine 5'-phosphate oxidase family protein n=1 Tax=Paenibacillus tarimensis TaxID=416012 RepID=UPI001F3B3752|nr:pyridoxamine 5'-phosphate oxidase family protein [Paenibacillus tarimensis]MCF2943012.1 pyridoxamine 5'-phosphate oxidase family protein [Paenibacillus tarimensis]
MYHAGELAVQRLAGEELLAERNRASIKQVISKGASAFLQSQTIVIVSTAGEDGKVWCSYLTGEPGFIKVMAESELLIASSCPESDPVGKNLQSNPAVGLLFIDFNRRIRLRINGRGAIHSGRGLSVQTEQVYGNCPKYIQKRLLQTSGSYHRLEKQAYRSSKLSPQQQEWIRRADTFFIGSSGQEGSMDASHRGGPAGFVQITDRGTLMFPDYFGNSMFNTLGNIHLNPNTGLLFIDFKAGHSLQLTGRSYIIWNEDQASLPPGAERMVRFEMDEFLTIENETPINWVLSGDQNI